MSIDTVIKLNDTTTGSHRVEDVIENGSKERNTCTDKRVKGAATNQPR